MRSGGSLGGGRHSISGVTATVFGATGFLGRYLTNELGKIGSQMIIPYRCIEQDTAHLRVMGDLGQIVLDPFNVNDPESVKKYVQDSNVVINCIGKDRQTWKYSYEKVNVEIPQMIARAAKEAGVERFYHMSCVGAHPEAPGKRFRTKFEGEQAVRAEFPQATILRMAPMVGVEDRLLNSIAFITRRMPFLPLYDGGAAKVQPVWVRDVVKAFLETLKLEDSKGKTFEFGGPETYTMKELVRLVEKTIREPSGSLNIPSELGKLLDAPRSFLQSQIPFPIPTHTMFTSDYIDELKSDLVVDDSALGFKDLGIEPSRIDQGVPIEHVRFWRSGGYDFGSEHQLE
jgi:NADH dehydrogenase (ubiquinone) 1 alpha subcomplex subunit 9